MKYKKIYSDSNEKYVERYVVYGDSLCRLFADSDYNCPIDADKLFDIYIRGLLIAYDGRLFSAIGYIEATCSVVAVNNLSWCVFTTHDYVLFEPMESDSLITSDDDRFYVIAEP